MSEENSTNNDYYYLPSFEELKTCDLVGIISDGGNLAKPELKDTKVFSVDMSMENFENTIIKNKHLENVVDYGDRITFNIVLEDDDFENKSGHPDDKQYYLSKHFIKLPYGLIDKSLTGLGATTLEMEAERDSIIVVPTKNLAYGKSLKGEGRYLYVGSKINEADNEVTGEDIRTYLRREDIRFKKIFVVADSLYKVIWALEAIYPDYKDTYFLLFDEIDKFIKDSGFRERLEVSFDYYLSFNKKNRAMITATIIHFSNPAMQEEEKTTFVFPQPQRDMKITVTNNSTALCYQMIKEIMEKFPNEKIFIAINSVKIPLRIINKFVSDYPDDPNFKDKFGLACSSVREKDVNVSPYFIDLNKEEYEGKLPRQVCFTTSTNFVGIDIEDDFHLITLSTLRSKHHVISDADIIQIYGRNRKVGGVLSDNFIFETEDIKTNSYDFAHEIEADLGDIEQPKTPKLELADKMVSLVEKFKEVKKEHYKHKSEEERKELIKEDIEKFVSFLNQNFYARNDINDDVIISYFLIDSEAEENYYKDVVYKNINNFGSITF